MVGADLLIRNNKNDVYISQGSTIVIELTQPLTL
jgi:hypothetical protein